MVHKNVYILHMKNKSGNKYNNFHTLFSKKTFVNLGTTIQMEVCISTAQMMGEGAWNYYYHCIQK